MKTVRIEIYGGVQGVNFRSAISKRCSDFLLHGYVCNRDDGSVLIVVQGDSKNIGELIKWVKNSPGLSNVERVVVIEVTAKFYYSNFKIIETGGFFNNQNNLINELEKNIFRK